MSNDFFNDHPMLGSMFDFDRDGSMSLGEAGAMGAFGAMYATEAMRAAEEAEHEASESPWDNGDKSYGFHDRTKSSMKAKREYAYYVNTPEEDW